MSMTLEEAQKVLYEQRGKVEAEAKQIDATTKQIDAYRKLHDSVFGDRGVLVEAGSALEYCDHSDTERSLRAVVSAYRLGDTLKGLYEVASKLIPKKIREAMYAGLNHAKDIAEVAFKSGRQHLHTEKQRSRLEKLLQTYKMAAGI